jgi:hypothetical protein
VRRVKIAELATALDPSDPDGFRAGSKPLGRDLGGDGDPDWQSLPR